MNIDTPEGDLLALLESLAGEHADAGPSCGSWHQGLRDSFPVFVSDIRTPVVALF